MLGDVYCELLIYFTGLKQLELGQAIWGAGERGISRGFAPGRSCPARPRGLLPNMYVYVHRYVYRHPGAILLSGRLVSIKLIALHGRARDPGGGFQEWKGLCCDLLPFQKKVLPWARNGKMRGRPQKIRAQPDSNQRPVELQSTAQPLSYIPPLNDVGAHYCT